MPDHLVKSAAKLDIIFYPAKCYITFLSFFLEITKKLRKFALQNLIIRIYHAHTQ